MGLSNLQRVIPMSSQVLEPPLDSSHANHVCVESRCQEMKQGEHILPNLRRSQERIIAAPLGDGERFC